ncbi:HTH_Tnp_Tc3_2 domain-containing protein [Trichonephila clavipes]|nr:HTH_Tnp_Tc3_2 domain-containing protein [Trichonephila clavipes]
MMEAGWSARRAARQLGRSDCVVRRYWNQWIREMSFTRRPGSGRLDKPVGEKTVTSALYLLEPYEGNWLKDILDRPLRKLPLTPAHRHLHLGWCHARGNWTAADGNRSSLATNPDLISAVMLTVFMCGDPVVNASILHLLYSDTPLPQLDRNTGHESVTRNSRTTIASSSVKK